jgi:hypothetical protein
MTEEEIRQQVKEILHKRDIGDDLTSQEEMMKVGPDTETGE